MAAEKELENGQFASLDSSQSQLQGQEELEKVSQSNFRNGLHEIMFVWVVTSAHWITVFFSPLLSLISLSLMREVNTTASQLR